MVTSIESVHSAIVCDSLDYLGNNNTLYSNIDIVMTNIDNKIVSFENPKSCLLTLTDHLMMTNCPLKFVIYMRMRNCPLKLVVHLRMMVRIIVLWVISNTKRTVSTKTHVLSSNSKQLDSRDRENIDQVDSAEEETEDQQNMFRTNTNETCLQPWLPDYPLDIDTAIESSCTVNTVTDLDRPQSSSAGNEIFSMAPGEGKHPVHFMTDKLCEEMAFPTLFPTSKFGFQVKRDVRLSPAKCFNARLLNYTERFAINPEYLFFAQYVTEQKKVQDSISIALYRRFMVIL